MEKSIYFILSLLIGIFLYSCANIARPDGGRRDDLPPVFVGSNPAPNSLNYDKHKVEIMFDELIQLKDQNDKVVVSPLEKEAPVIKAQGKKVVISFRDSLMENTTYSIDFADAIQDLNEGNPLDGFSFAFSTGNNLDSLQISGMVLGARDLEPQQKVLVGIYDNLSDTAFNKLPFLRVARTNELGQFTLRNLKPGKYHIFALNDVDRDYKFANPGEDLAFYDNVIVPSSISHNKVDTIFTLDHKIDTIITHNHTNYLPNDVLLSMFNEEYKAQYLVNYNRVSPNRLEMIFNAPSDLLPKLEILNHKAPKEWYRLDKSEHNDTLNLWLTDSSMIKMDSISIAASYLRTDSTQKLSQYNDTLLFKLKKEKPKKIKKHENKEHGDSVPPVKVDLIDFRMINSGSQDINLPINFTSNAPIDTILQDSISFEIKKDSTWTKLPAPLLKRQDSNSLLKYQMTYDWKPGETYRLTIDSLAIKSIYGLYNKKIEQQFAVKALEEYSTLSFSLNVKDHAFVELLSPDDKVVTTATVINGEALFEYLNPSTYFARIVLDRNGNGKYDTGNYARKQQPEEVYYFNKKLKLKKNWDVTENWDIYALPLDNQKPNDIKKNKPASKKWDKDKEKDKNKKNGNENDEDEESSFGKNIYDINNNNNKNNYNNSNYR